MPTLWQVDNFRNGIHTKPAEVAEGAGESYARDALNLAVDGDGFLRTRPGFTVLGPDGDNITGVAVTSDSIWTLRTGGTLYRRLLTDLETETIVPGTANLSGRISVVEPAQGYVILTSEGEDQGYWIDLRPGETLQAHPLGIDKPDAADVSITKYPSDQLVEDTGTSDVELVGPSIFVAYAISYVRQFDQIIGEKEVSALFNGMESELSDPVGFVFKRLDFKNDDHGPSSASTYQMATFDFSALVEERTILPLTLSRTYRTAGGVENTRSLRVEPPGGVRIGYVEIEEGSEFITNLTALTNGEKIVFRPASGADVVLTLTADNAVDDNPANPDPGGFIAIALNSYTLSGTFVADTVYALYPANADGSIKDVETIYSSNLPDQITGINIYRSEAFNSRSTSVGFDQITELFENDPDRVDLSALEWHRVAYIPRDRLHLQFSDGIFAVKGDDENQVVNSGDRISDITGYRAYYHTIEFADDNFTGVIITPPPDVGVSREYPWYVDFLMTLGITGVSVTVYGEGGLTAIPAGGSPFLLPPVQDVNSVYFYRWTEGEIPDFTNGARLPASVKQIVLHNDRIFAPAGDRLIYSDFSGTQAQYWNFPASNVYHRLSPGPVDFCVSFRLDTAGEARGALLFGSRDGMSRLTGDPDTQNDEIVHVADVGPLDGYGVGAMRDTLGFVAEGGLYLTNSVQIESISDVALDRFFEGAHTTGAVAFFSDNTMLFAVGEQLFLFEDSRWMRWDGLQATYFVGSGDTIYTALGGQLVAISRLASASNPGAVNFAWQSNLIHGQAAGVSNEMKRFRELYVSAAEGADLTLKTWVDNNPTPVETSFTVRDELSYQHRVPIERMGRRLRFRLEGAGDVEIRGLRIEGDVMARV